MTLVEAFWIALWIVGVAVMAMTATIVATKVARTASRRRTARLVAEVRPVVLAAIYEGGDPPVFSDRRAKVAESIAIALLPKLRGDDRNALARMLDANGVIDHAVAGLHARSGARRQRSAELLGNAGVVEAERDLACRLHDSDGDVRIAAARALGRIGDPRSVPGIFQALAERRVPANTASMAVLRIGSPGASSIVAAIASPEPLVRSTAVELAGSLGVMDARVAIEALLDDLEPMVRASAARALGRLSMPASAPPLIRRLDRALSMPVERADEEFLVPLVEALGRIGHRSSIPCLEACFMRRHRLSLAASAALAGMGARRPQSSRRESALAPPEPDQVRFDLPAPIWSHA